MMWLTDGEKIEDIFTGIHFDRIHERDGRTDIGLRGDK